MSVPSTEPVTRLQALTRPATEGDATFLADLYTSCRGQEVRSYGWDDSTVSVFLSSQHQARERWFAQVHPDADHLVLLADGLLAADGGRAGSPVGRLLVDRSADLTHLVDVAVHPGWQRRGIGTAALRALLGERPGVPVRLTVRRDNPARLLYDRLGFRVTADDGLDLAMQATA